MQLVINTYGAYLRKNGNCFLVKREDKSFEVAVGKVTSILITTAADITTDAIKLAVDNNIDIVFLDAHGEPYGRVWHPRLGSTTLIRRRQLELYDSPEGLNLAKEWGQKKLDNQIGLLNRLKKTREEKRDELEKHIEDISESRERMQKLRGTIDARRQDMLGLEGKASRSYFEAISSVMPERYRFAGRSRNPAKDEFNALLNYGYGILYSLVEKACIIAGLDPYVGFLHTDEKGTVSVFILKDDRKEFYKYSYDPFLISKTLDILRPIKGPIKESEFLDLNNKYFKAVKRGMGEMDSKESLDCIAGLAFKDLSEKFKLIEEDYPKVDVFVELDDRAEEIWKQYRDMQSEKNPLERTKKYLKIKKDFSEYLISADEKYAHYLVGDDSGIGYISRAEIPNYYDEETGFMRAGAGGGSMIT